MTIPHVLPEIFPPQNAIRTPLIAKAVHQCFSRDAQLQDIDSSDNANLTMPAAISVLKPCTSDAHDYWVDLLMAGQPPKPEEKGWPLPADASSAPPQAKGWRRMKQKSQRQNIDENDIPMEKAGRRPKARRRTRWAMESP